VHQGVYAVGHACLSEEGRWKAAVLASTAPRCRTTRSTIKEGIPVTTAPRTLFDLAAVVSHGQLARAVNEDRFLAFLARLGLPLPATNVSMRVGGRWIEADCVWHEERLIAELDGHTTHRTRAAFETDRTRDRTLTAAGWRVIRITWRQLHDDPKGLGRDLRVFLAA
jgi:hypothetical protein